MQKVTDLNHLNEVLELLKNSIYQLMELKNKALNLIADQNSIYEKEIMMRKQNEAKL